MRIIGFFKNSVASVPNIFGEMKKDIPISKDKKVNAYVQCVAKHVTDVIPPQTGFQNWEVVVFDSEQVNAFALPGGKIGVHSGLLELAENQAQLATVIGHEIAHVLADHGNERLTQELGLQAGMLLVGLFTESEIAEDQIQQALGIGAQLGITLPFSRAHEEEADLMGLDIMARAGFEPGQSVRLWQHMAQASGAQPLEFLSTHPNHNSRIASLQNQLATARSVFETVPPANCQI